VDRAAETHVARPLVSFGRETCGDLAAGLRREWLVTNGLGGYASGTLAGVHTRRYHGLLVPAFAPPLARAVLFSKLEEEVRVEVAGAHIAGPALELGAFGRDIGQPRLRFAPLLGQPHPGPQAAIALDAVVGEIAGQRRGLAPERLPQALVLRSRARLRP